MASPLWFQLEEVIGLVLGWGGWAVRVSFKGGFFHPLEADQLFLEIILFLVHNFVKI